VRAVLLLVHGADAPSDASVSAPQSLIDAAATWFRSVSYGRVDFHVRTPATSTSAILNAFGVRADGREIRL